MVQIFSKSFRVNVQLFVVILTSIFTIIFLYIPRTIVDCFYLMVLQTPENCPPLFNNYLSYHIFVAVVFETKIHNHQVKICFRDFSDVRKNAFLSLVDHHFSTFEPIFTISNELLQQFSDILYNFSNIFFFFFEQKLLHIKFYTHHGFVKN